MHPHIAAAIRSSLRDRIPVPDELFDTLYPEQVRRRSHTHWTPVSVAVRAAVLLAPRAGMRVLDAGAGPGKLCCIGALVTNASWYGVERDLSLVETAAESAEALDVSACAQFRSANVAAVDWDEFDSVYLFNPFEAALVGERTAHLTAWTQYVGEVAGAEAKLASLRPGARVVTYHGFGGEMPSSFARLSSEQVGVGSLDLWEKLPVTSSAPARWRASR
ncbi:MAG: methyltransferase domain-containing protein [Myxococcales bacterium]|nr:methyltransferase domain-containing protein [Myxococcales bacterium]